MNVTGKPVYAGTIGGGTHARSVPSSPLHPYRACVVRRTWHAESSLYTHMYIYLHDGTRDTRAYTAAYTGRARVRWYLYGALSGPWEWSGYRDRSGTSAATSVDSRESGRDTTD